MTMVNLPYSAARTTRANHDRAGRVRLATYAFCAAVLLSLPSTAALTADAGAIANERAGIVLAQSNVPSTGGGGGGEAPAASGEGGGGGAPAQQPSQVPFLIMMVAIFAFFYLFIIRPQNKQQKEHDRLVKGLKKGDQVITQGGVFGRISDFDDANNAVVIEVAKGVRIKMLRTQVARMQGTEPAADDKKAAKGRS